MKFGFRLNPGKRRPAGPVGKVFHTLFFLVFAGFGTLFIWGILAQFARHDDQRSWQPTDCVILSSDMTQTDDEENPYRFEVRYSYEVDGRPYTGETFTSGYEGTFDMVEIERLIDRYRPDSDSTCLVDPADASKSALQVGSQGNPLNLLVLLVPAMFIVVGVGGVYMTWAPAKQAAAISRKANARSGLWMALAVSSFFFLFGAAFSLPVILKPLVKMQRSRGWAKTPCEVVASNLRSYRNGKSVTYRADILYRYTFAGRTHRSNGYGFFSVTTNSRRWKAEAVQAHPAGSQSVCYVNPDDPFEAVLDRGWQTDMLFGIIPASLLLGGATGIFFTTRSIVRGRTSPRSAPSWQPRLRAGRRDFPHDLGTSVGVEPVTFTVGLARAGKLAGVLFFAVFWNGIVSVFLVQLVNGWRNGRPDYFLTVFLIPFVVIGLGAIGGIFYYALGCLNPRPTLRVNGGRFRPGDTLALTWSFSGSVGRIRRLVIALEGREEATYRRGTSTSTDKNTFASFPLVETDEADRIPDGRATFAIPADTMHSFEAPNNKIVWDLTVKGDIQYWPDVKEEFRIALFPASTREGRL